MATTREYADFILSKFERLEVVSIRPMMGEYVIHMAGKVLGFISDEQLLLQDGPVISRLMPDVRKRELFPGSKLFCVIPDGMSSAELCNIAEAIYDDLPISRPRKKKKTGQKQQSAPQSSFPFEKHIKW